MLESTLMMNKREKQAVGLQMPDEAAVMIPPAVAKRAEGRLLVEMPPTFDAEGDMGVIGRICADYGPDGDELGGSPDTIRFDLKGKGMNGSDLACRLL
ncbi:hypothetical protein WJX72_009161 [[Myrmecia] bisecta]|uniref:Uncharacterized protein n=1 Tax=[Myrmecia] bisecta TaxID=41462 RepID=A0AAW1R8Z9_9CHLO